MQHRERQKRELYWYMLNIMFHPLSLKINAQTRWLYKINLKTLQYHMNSVSCFHLKDLFFDHHHKLKRSSLTTDCENEFS